MFVHVLQCTFTISDVRFEKNTAFKRMDYLIFFYQETSLFQSLQISYRKRIKAAVEFRKTLLQENFDHFIITVFDLDKLN